MRPTKNLLVIAFCCLLGASGCGLIYKQNVQQGNALDQEKLDQLKIGMTMNQVAYLLGTPAIRDPFHQSRWDYLYSYARRGGDATVRKVTLRFENAVLQEMTGTDPEDPDKSIVAGNEPSIPGPDAIEAPVDVEPVVTAIETPSERSPIDETNGEASVAGAAEVPATPDPAGDPDEAKTEEAPTVDLDMSEVPADVRPAESEPSNWLIQIGAFDDLQNARNLVNRLNNAGFSVAVYGQQVGSLGTRYLVRSDGFDSRADAERQLQQIKQAFDLQGFLVPPTNQREP